MLAFADEILGDDVFTAGWEYEFQTVGDFSEGAVEGGGAADDAEGEEEHGEKCEEHVECDGLAESDAAWKDATKAAEESFEYALHRSYPRDYTGSHYQSCELSERV
jgi:hypothetical protein